MSSLLKPLKSLFGRREAGAPPGPGRRAEEACETPGGSPLAQPAAGEEVALQHLWSDEPNAIKLQLNRNLLPLGEKRVYHSAEEATDAPLARAIFEAGGIEAVTLEGVYITALMEPDADWEAILQRLPEMIRKFFAAGGTPVLGADGRDAGQPQKRYRFGFREVQGRPRDEQMELVQKLFDEEVNPAVAAHGGHFTLLDVQDNTVYVELGGGCQGCGMANVTLRQGVEQRLREVLPEVVALVDQTDHAAGTNPYYQASKK